MERENKAKYGGIQLLYVAIICIILGCSCPDQKPCPDCEDCPDAPLIDSNVICDLCMENYKLTAFHFWSSIKIVRMIEIINYYYHSKNEIDSLISLMNIYENYLDSLKGSKIFDNMIIKGDTLRNVEAVFDEETGKPKLVIK